ncbi:MAG: bifunctional metallophosphatase/5'-nucleotidase [Firmicutes bacterium]|nr:bifunctional metallophosphatase/5'-nucleotidase [Candidatus Fiminaster equi]
MNSKKLLTLLAVLPLLAGCGQNEEKGDLVIPTVDVDSIVPVLPNRPEYNTGDIKTDGTNDFIDIYELSDFHGAVNYETHSSGNYLGLPKLASYLDIKRNDNQGGTVVVSSGDMFQGSAESNLTRGYMVNYAMNYMGFDSMAIGNHEFDWTDTWLKKNANLDYKGHKTPFISANIVKTETNETPDFLQKSTIISRKGYKIGIIGSIGKGLKSSILKSCVEGYDFLDEVDSVNAEAARLKNVENCNIVILTSHNDIETIGSKALENVDAVFGGHSHESKKGTISGAAAAQTVNYGASIAHIQLSINKETKAVSCSVCEVDENPTQLAGLQEKAEIKTIMNNYSSAIGDIKNIKLGEADNNFTISAGLKNVCVESMYQGAVKANKDNNLGIPEDKILATFHNVEGGIRKDISKGNIVYGDVYASFPFDNEICFYKVKGSAFKGALKYNEVVGIGVRRTFSNNNEIDDNTDYYLVVTDFIAFSTDYLGAAFNITDADLVRTGKVVRDEVANLIYKTETIKLGNFKSGVSPYVGLKRIQ